MRCLTSIMSSHATFDMQHAKIGGIILRRDVGGRQFKGRKHSRRVAVQYISTGVPFCWVHLLTTGSHEVSLCNTRWVNVSPHTLKSVSRLLYLCVTAGYFEVDPWTVLPLARQTATRVWRHASLHITTPYFQRSSILLIQERWQWRNFVHIYMPVDFCRHLVGKNS